MIEDVCGVMINRVYSCLMASRLRTGNVSNPALSLPFPLEFVLLISCSTNQTKSNLPVSSRRWRVIPGRPEIVSGIIILSGLYGITDQMSEREKYEQVFLEL